MAGLLNRILRTREYEPPPAVVQHDGLRRRLDLGMPISRTEFVSVDTELTGLDPRRDSVISIGAIRMRGTRILTGQTFYRLVRPSTELKHQGVLVHELTHSDLEQASEPADALNDFLEFIGDAVMIGHFVSIETTFLSRAMKQAFGVGLRTPAVDTSSLHDWLNENDSGFARHHGGMSLKTDLFSVARRYGIDVHTAHDAFVDAFITAQLFQRLVYFLPECGVRTLRELLAVGKP